MRPFYTSCNVHQLFGLTISLAKTEALHHPTPAPNVFINDTQPSVVENFKQLGSTISINGSLDKVNTRTCKASQALEAYAPG